MGISEDLQSVTKDKKQAISKLDNESDVNGDASKQLIEEDTQIDALNLDNSSHQVKKQKKVIKKSKTKPNEDLSQNNESENKMANENMQVDMKQKTISDQKKEEDKTKDAGKESQNNIVSSIEESSGPDGII